VEVAPVIFSSLDGCQDNNLEMVAGIIQEFSTVYDNFVVTCSEYLSKLKF